jgi:small subunit ribosomal protein S1
MSNQETHEPETMSQLMETSFAGRTTSVGDVVSGKIVKITGEAAFVDYGAKSEGMVNLAELRDETGALAHDVGATIDLVVAETKGYVRLSFRDAQAGKARVALKEAWKKQEPVRGKVVGTNKGGYEIRIDGVRAFCPLSQLADRFVQDPQSMVGQEFEFRITEWDDAKGAVVSRRALIEVEREKSREALSGRFNVGDLLQGHVTQLRDFGAFVDLGGVEGLIHVSEMGKKRVKHPSERLKVGDAVEVTVVKLEADKGRIALRLKDGENDADPWADFVKTIEPGTRLQGKVARIQSYGAFVTIAPEVDGLLHVSAITTARRIESPAEIIQVGQELEVVVEGVDLQKNRIALCTVEVYEKRGAGAPVVHFEVGQIVKGRVSRVERFGLFIDIGPRTSGLLPMSELDHDRSSRAEDLYPIGTEVESKIIEIEDVMVEAKDGKKGGMRKKIRLSRKALKGDSEQEDFRAWRQQQSADQKRSTATFGDLFAAKLKQR